MRGVRLRYNARKETGKNAFQTPEERLAGGMHFFYYLFWKRGF